MNPTQLLLVAAAGAVGALVRGEVTTRSRTPLDGALLVNTLGAFALGVATMTLGASALQVVGGGLLGALTTFSTWVLLAEEDPRPAGATLGLALVVGVLAAAAGRLVGGLL